jgi:Tol biopolymer transport system component
MALTRASMSTIAAPACAAVLSAAFFFFFFADPERARAAFPGNNGKVVFEMRSCYRCDPSTSPVMGELYTVEPDGGGLTRLTHSDDTTVEIDPAWSPDGKRIAFAKTVLRVRDEADIVRNGVYLKEVGIHLISADGSEERKVTDSGRSPDWSPSGEKLAFVKAGEVYSVDADGTNLIQLTEEGGEEPSWSPNGKWIAFEADRDGQGTGDPSTAGYKDADVYVMRSDGSQERKIVEVPLGRNGLGGDPDWSPDGKKIAFVDADPGVPDTFGPPSSFYHTEVFTVAPDGTRKRPITSLPDGFGGLIQPAWSPNGKEIAALRRPTSGPGTSLLTYIFVGKVGGTEMRNLVGYYSLGPPDWQPLPKKKKSHRR